MNTPINIEVSAIGDSAVPTGIDPDTEDQDCKHPAPSLLPTPIAITLMISGFAHLGLLWFLGAEWTGPLSPRKPGLFGLSAGLTVWSLAWVVSQFRPGKLNRSLVSFMSRCLLLEVGLITLQYWRGVPSHFNRTTTFDAIVESIMLTLILLVTLGVAWLCWNSRRLLPMEESRAISIRAGLWFLLVACLLGFLATIIGEIHLVKGMSPEIWGRGGVLKYPHGAVLHAIQTLPALSVLLEKLRVSSSARVIRAAVNAHFLFLFHALWQTFHGLARTEIQWNGIAAMAVAALVLMLWNPAARMFCAGRSQPRGISLTV